MHLPESRTRAVRFARPGPRWNESASKTARVESAQPPLRRLGRNACTLPPQFGARTRDRKEEAADVSPPAKTGSSFAHSVMQRSGPLKQTPAMRSVALDLALKQISFCKVGGGDLLARRTVSSPSSSADVLGPACEPARMAIEARREASHVPAELTLPEAKREAARGLRGVTRVTWATTPSNSSPGTPSSAATTSPHADCPSPERRATRCPRSRCPRPTWAMTPSNSSRGTSSSATTTSPHADSRHRNTSRSVRARAPRVPRAPRRSPRPTWATNPPRRPHLVPMPVTENTSHAVPAHRFRGPRGPGRHRAVPRARHPAATTTSLLPMPLAGMTSHGLSALALPAAPRRSPRPTWATNPPRRPHLVPMPVTGNTSHAVRAHACAAHVDMTPSSSSPGAPSSCNDRPHSCECH
jgi:hypothetical protein